MADHFRATSIEQNDTNDILALTKELISRASVTPQDMGCQDLIAERLIKLGFTIYSLPFGEVQNLWAVRGTESPLFVFAGHTDVVPPGNLLAWETSPFIPEIKDGILYGRGAQDMKSSIAAMVTAVEDFIKDNPDYPGSIGFLLTSDEEGPAKNGTKKVIEYLIDQGIKIDYCIVGEPSSHEKLGDTIKIGRRGSMSGALKVHGLQGHIAYPDKACNPIHHVLQPLSELTARKWDEGNLHFSPTSFQISNLNSGTGAGNIIPGILECHFNFRFSTEHTPESLQSEVHRVMEAHTLKYEIEWDVSGLPFITAPGRLLQVCQSAILEINNIEPTLSTTGGTSDARFIASEQTEVLELGPRNNTIHQVNEGIELKDLYDLYHLYRLILVKLFQ